MRGQAVLLAQLGRVVRPLRRDAPFFDVALFPVGVALFRRGDNRGIDDIRLDWPDVLAGRLIFLPEPRDFDQDAPRPTVASLGWGEASVFALEFTAQSIWQRMTFRGLEGGKIEPGPAQLWLDATD